MRILRIIPLAIVMACAPPFESQHKQPQQKAPQHTVLTVAAESGLVLRAEPGIASVPLSLMPDGTRIRLRRNAEMRTGTVGGVSGYWVPVQYKNQSGWAFNRYLLQKENPVLFQNHVDRYFIIESNPGAICFLDNTYRSISEGECAMVLVESGRTVARIPWIYAQGWLDENRVWAAKGDAHAGVMYSLLYAYDLRDGSERMLGSYSSTVPFEWEAAANILEMVTVCTWADTIRLCCSIEMSSDGISAFNGDKFQDAPVWTRNVTDATLNPVPGPHQFGFVLKSGEESEQVLLNSETCARMEL